jgi:heme exporter protein A
MLKAQSLKCRRGKRILFQGLDIDLNKGDAWVVTGANGSGKSSLLRCLAKLLPLTDGKILWNDSDVAEEPEHYIHQLNYIGHLDAVKPEVTVAQMLYYWGALYGCTGQIHHDPFHVLELHEKPIRSLSAGQKRRLTLSRLFLKPAALWLLDEPATALDKGGQQILVKEIARHRMEGGIIVVATHHDMPLAKSMHYHMSGGSV